jgi:hypothetical protein
MQKAGGKICASHSEATHVIVQARTNPSWDAAIPAGTRKGIWFMKPRWVHICLEEGRKIPESAWIVEGGEPTVQRTVTASPVKASVQSGFTPQIGWSDGIEEKLGESSRAVNRKHRKPSRFSVEEMSDIFQKESKLVEDGMTLMDLSKYLVEKVGLAVINR